MSRTAEILQKALDELGAQTEEPAPSRTELLLAESIKLAKLTKVAQRISKEEFEVLFEEMEKRFIDLRDQFAYYQALNLFGMAHGRDFEDNIKGREKALRAYKQCQITIAQLETPEGWR